MGDRVEAVTLIRLLADEFERRGWRDPGDAALEMARILEGGGTARAASRAAPSRFLGTNNITRSDVEEAATTVLNRLPPTSRPDDAVPTGTGSASGNRRASVRRAENNTAPNQQARPRLVARVIAAVALTVVGTALIWQAPMEVGWTWLLEHDNRLALQSLAQAVVVLVAIAVATWRWPVAAAASAPLVGLLGLLGN